MQSRSKPQFQTRAQRSDYSEESSSRSAQSSEEEPAAEVHRPGKKLVINENMNRLHHIPQEDSDDSAIAERSGEESSQEHCQEHQEAGESDPDSNSAGQHSGHSQ